MDNQTEAWIVIRDSGEAWESFQMTIGAFSTKELADNFADKHTAELEKLNKISNEQRRLLNIATDALEDSDLSNYDFDKAIDALEEQYPLALENNDSMLFLVRGPIPFNPET